MKIKKSPEELAINEAKWTMQHENRVRKAAWTSLVCFILLSTITVVNGDNGQDNSSGKTATGSLTLQQLQTLYSQLQDKCNSVTAERDQLQAKCDSVTSERDQLQTNYDNLETENKKLKSSNSSLGKTADELLTSNKNLTSVNDQLQLKLLEVNSENVVVKAQLAQALQQKGQPNASSGCFKVGDQVKLKASDNSSKMGWGDVFKKSVGYIAALDGEITVDFPDPNSGYFRVGDQVRVKSSVTTPKYGWGNVSNKSVGVVTEVDGDTLIVDFPEKQSWKGSVSEMELAPSADSGLCQFNLGDKVRMKSSVDSPKYGWGCINNTDVGLVKALILMVDFPEQSDWSGEPTEMEIAE